MSYTSIKNKLLFWRSPEIELSSIELKITNLKSDLTCFFTYLGDITSTFVTNSAKLLSKMVLFTEIISKVGPNILLALPLLITIFVFWWLINRFNNTIALSLTALTIVFGLNLISASQIHNAAYVVCAFLANCTELIKLVSSKLMSA